VTPPSVLVLGAGSAGSRHARLLGSAGAAVTITDPDSERATATALATIPFDLDGIGGYDAVVVASPSVFHPEQTLAALATGAKVLVEKPLATHTEPLDAIVAAAGDRLMVGYNLRFHEPVARVVELVREGRVGRVHAAHVWFGSWLPDWRPTVDYRTTYSAQRALGGGVLLDAIHELDVLLWLFGDDQFAVEGAVVDRVGPLAIDVEDTVTAVLRHDSGAVVDLSLDYLSRRYRRGAEVIGAEATVRLDWARAVIEIEDASGVECLAADSPVSASYERQAEHFLRFVAGEAAPPVDADEGARSVRLAAAIRDAAR
jgi:predicted dehydrogenase